MAQSSLPSQQALWVHRAKRCRQHNTAAEKVTVTCWGMCPRPCQRMHAHQRGEVTTTHILLPQVYIIGVRHAHTHVRQHTVPHTGTSCKSPEPKVSHTSSTAAAASHSSPRSGAHSSPGKVTNTRAYHGTTLLLSASRLIHTQPKSCSDWFGGAADVALLYNLKKREAHSYSGDFLNSTIQYVQQEASGSSSTCHTLDRLRKTL
jgi:hypothetical protein